MRKNSHSLKSIFNRRYKAQDTKLQDEKQLHSVLFKRPMSRRMAATAIGYTDLTYMVTQIIFDMIKDGRAQVVGRIKCERSGHYVEAISTNPEQFKSRFNNNLETFE